MRQVADPSGMPLRSSALKFLLCAPLLERLRHTACIPADQQKFLGQWLSPLPQAFSPEGKPLMTRALFLSFACMLMLVTGCSNQPSVVLESPDAEALSQSEQITQSQETLIQSIGRPPRARNTSNGPIRPSR